LESSTIKALIVAGGGLLGAIAQVVIMAHVKRKRKAEEAEKEEE